jgi:hypothetical protein
MFADPLAGILGIAAFPAVLFLASLLTARVKRIRPGLYCMLIGLVVLFPGLYVSTSLGHETLGYFLLGNGVADLLLGLLFILIGKDGMLLPYF